MFVLEEYPRCNIGKPSRLMHVDRAVVMLPSSLSSIDRELGSQIDKSQLTRDRLSSS